MRRTAFVRSPIGMVVASLCVALVAGCDSTTQQQVPATPAADDVRVGPIPNSWSADALPAAGDRPTWIAATSHKDGFLSLWALEPKRQFRLVGTYSEVGFHPDGVRWADLDADGRPELLVAAEGASKVQVWRPVEGGEGLTLVATVPVGSPLDVVAGDLDADERADLVATHYEAGWLSIAWGRGALAFDISTLPEKPDASERRTSDSAEKAGEPEAGRREPRRRPADRRARRPDGPRAPDPYVSHGRIADWDGDGRPDILWSDRRGGAILFGRNLGERRFEIRELRPAEGGSPRQIALADLDGDGALDLVAALETGGKGLVLYNDGQGGVRATEEIPAPSWGFSNVTAVGGAEPLVVLTLDQSVILARRQPDGWKQRRLSTGGFPLDPKLVDLDGDGALDLLVANSTGEDLSVVFGPLWERAKELEE